MSGDDAYSRPQPSIVVSQRYFSYLPPRVIFCRRDLLQNLWGAGPGLPGQHIAKTQEAGLEGRESV